MDRGFPVEQTRITARDFPFPTSLLHILPQRRCSDSDPKKSLQLTESQVHIRIDQTIQKRGYNTEIEKFCQQLGLPHHLRSVALGVSAILDHGHSVDNWER